MTGPSTPSPPFSGIPRPVPKYVPFNPLRAHVRTITVKGQTYVQVIRRKPGTRTNETLATFGQKDMESLLRANLFADTFNSAIKYVLDFRAEMRKDEYPLMTFFAVYGWILGMKTIRSIVKEAW